jgi:hypothetical protein
MQNEVRVAENAFVLRISPSGYDKVPEALREKDISIGWSCSPGLLDDGLDWDSFRERLRQNCYPNDADARRVGHAAGHMWRFVRGMKPGDLVVVPHGPQFYVAKVTEEARYDESRASEDTAYRRSVKWLNGARPISRSLARSALVSRMKIQGTCANAGDLVDEIKECLALAERDEKPTFEKDLQQRLISHALEEIRSGRIDPYGFENLIRDLMEHLGALQAWVVPRSQDVGVDVYAAFRVAGAFRLLVGMQAKHWNQYGEVDADTVEELINGLENGGESVGLGMVITSGAMSYDRVWVMA